MNNGKISVFTTHRDKVLGYYGTASWLRQLVLAMWNGTDHQVGMSTLATLDNDHAAAALAMIQSYRQLGERDPAFMSLALECQQRLEAEHAEARRVARFESWCKEVQFDLKVAGMRSHFVDDHYTWFERQFNAGMEPGAAARLALQSNLDEARSG
ncbi:hypothetical protein LAV84_29955 [Rhizobium sp. VS19-DR104.2]|uniref:DUF7673 family protein n=1 Tax=Rhizobium/Agrobacterium group TaxID=227290 RepID=UPI001CC56F08|nr:MULTISPECIES: hypothetical protein [unclassified Rhizobium]MBZ5763814.1 hypothetical protein [Rhizobium sp. VS19-DR96]MBZ5769741.1 hypothetical protein [Rhizobium sp. VS19-DR129.2]MBZ5777283.1 hypothetical protein [Rhizobium sp. VS19-DRK62.2]MBZ5788400.1 hypothetical protein [Rhizobium sp. VS19-DR121]MBZ5805863.1 hypothetical protein [Rhizobium sp. VS19-DR181]